MSDNTFLSNLLVNLGCRADRAREVISTALEDGEDPAYLRNQIEQWRAYCLGPRGENIRAVGFFVAAKIEQNQPAPDLTPRRVDVAAAWQADIARYRAIREAIAIYATKHTAPPLTIGWQIIEDRLKVLYDLQDLWIEQQSAISEAACILDDYGYHVDRAPWSWSDSPHAVEIARLETMLEAEHVSPVR